LRYKPKNKGRNRVEAASFLDERIVDMSAEILSEAEIKVSNAVELGTNMLSAVKSTQDAASAGCHYYSRCAVCRSELLQ
jgi:ferredoxin